MLGFKSKQMSDVELSHQLKQVFEQCDVSDFKSKRFYGLLHDYIPYNNGLKTRLEIIGRSGYAEKLLKLGRDARGNAQKVDAFSNQLSTEYGFKMEIIQKTFKLMADAAGIPLEVQVPPETVLVNSVKGNFSKNHLPESGGQSQPSGEASNRATQVRSEIKSSYKKRFIRNKSNLMKLMLFIVLMTAGSLYLNFYFSNFDLAQNAVKTVLLQYGALIISGSLLISVIMWLGYKQFKINLSMFLPIVVLIIQLLCIVLKVESTKLYEVVQMGMLLGLNLSFIMTTGYSIRLPKGAKEFISYKAIYGFYAAGLLYFLGQYLVRISVV